MIKYRITSSITLGIVLVLLVLINYKFYLLSITQNSHETYKKRKICNLLSCLLCFINIVIIVIIEITDIIDMIFSLVCLGLTILYSSDIQFEWMVVILTKCTLQQNHVKYVHATIAILILCVLIFILIHQSIIPNISIILSAFFQ